ncbi:monovalent cation/H+ antiporter subunit D family protein [Candidatus Eisenbacteria bacterium]|uniref:Monovalent cation/H+ antiporter subunit D family protein n=1 Tax=Eiseniibacteriota bacterium TaxID=2212470 RepID=A0ABV6YJU3_UNCEI
MDLAETLTSMRPLWAILVSLIAIPLIVASGKRPNLRETWTLLAAFIKLGIVLSMLPWVLQGRVAACTLWEISPGISLSLRVDTLGYVFAIVASSLWVLTSFYSIGYVRGANEHKQTRYFSSFALCLSATMGICFAANLVTFVIFFEILTLATYPLVMHKETPVAMSAGRKYLCYTLPAGLCLLLTAAWCVSVAGNVDFVPGGFLTTAVASTAALQWMFLFFILGVGVKAGIMPLQSWLPAAMAAPTPVSALLHAVAVVKAGVFGVLRVTGYVFGPEVLRDIGAWTVLAWAAAITLTVGSLLAMRQDNLKRRLAYSTVAHLSYIVLGAALFTSSSWTGSVMHLMFHATMKITLFFCAGAIYVRTHKENISDMHGIGRQMPFTMAAFAIGSLGLAGVPGVNGFVSKWNLAVGAVQADQTVFLGLLLLSGLLNAAYFFPIVHVAFFKKNKEFPSYGEASPLMVVPLSLTAIISIVLGLSPNLGVHAWDLARGVASAVIGAAP